jgi:hypothetical protein
MKYLKTYEQSSNDPKVGEYVKIDSNKFNFELIEFFNKEIGKIDSINQKELEIGGFPYYVIFQNATPNSSFGPSDQFMAFRKKELLAWAPTKKKLQLEIDINKYNL